MNPEHVRVLVARRMQQATEALEDGRYLLAAGRGARTAVNRAYYAAFYAVLALLQALGKTPRKHRGVLALFDTECVRTGRLPKELSAALHQLFDARQEEIIADLIQYCLRKPRNSSPSRSNLCKLYVIICLIPGISRESSTPDNATEHSMPVEQHHPALERILSLGQEVEAR